MSLVMGRRALIAGGVGLLLPGTAFASTQERLAFHVFRNGTKVGEHLMTFTGDDQNRLVSTDVALTVKVGPVPVYRYRHTAVERWAGGRWSSIETTTNGNGRVFKASGRSMGDHVAITGPKGPLRGPADAVPLSHWNQANFGRPLFNPQEGVLLKVRVTRVKPGHWQIRGDAEIDNFYDASGNWLALKGKLEDGSTMEYKRV